MRNAGHFLLVDHAVHRTQRTVGLLAWGQNKTSPSAVTERGRVICHQAPGKTMVRRLELVALRQVCCDQQMGRSVISKARQVIAILRHNYFKLA